MAEWVCLGPAEGFPEAKPVMAMAEGRPVVVGRAGGRLFAFQDKCPHAGAALHDGKFEKQAIQCGRHGWCFDVFSGESLPEASAFRLEQYAVQERGGAVWVCL